MRATLIHRTPGGLAAWSVKFRGETHQVIAQTGSDACISIIDRFV